jgi:hypothetical protein
MTSGWPSPQASKQMVVPSAERTVVIVIPFVQIKPAEGFSCLKSLAVRAGPRQMPMSSAGEDIRVRIADDEHHQRLVPHGAPATD